MTEKILILDFGSQYTQLIARAVREANVYCEITPFSKKIDFDPSLKGIILSGSPFSVNDKGAPEVDIAALHAQLPVLGVCYGAQLTAKQFGGRVANSNKREYGRALLHKQKDGAILQDVSELSQVWMSHADTILDLPAQFEVLANTENIPYAAFRMSDGLPAEGSANGGVGGEGGANGGTHPLYCLQFHPEVYHSIEGKKIIRNFLVNVCGCKQDWTPAHFISDTVAELKRRIGDRQVIMALSGGVDSTVAATLIHKAIGSRLHGIFVDNGVLRKDE
ncbi:MAG TPA: GMP synthase (glutamine-hydrolyzing), partial [Puia sp.]|nr:GMP synthase (glutamine-hydrolyzing) [Puia sp.]